MDTALKALLVLFGMFFCFLAGLTMNLPSAERTVGTDAQIVTDGLQAYVDGNCSEVLYFVDWGIVAPNQTVTRSCYVRNLDGYTYNVRCYAENFTPSELGGFCRFWANMNTSRLAEGEVASAVFNLHIYENVTGVENFSFDIILKGET